MKGKKKIEKKEERLYWWPCDSGEKGKERNEENGMREIQKRYLRKHFTNIEKLEGKREKIHCA